MTGDNQVGALTWPTSGQTGWDTPLKANIETLRTAHNAADTAAKNAQAAADSAATTAGGKYTKPGTGIPAADLHATVQSQLTTAGNAMANTERVEIVRRYVGGAWENADGVPVNAVITWIGPVSAGLPPDGVQGGHQYARAGVDGYVGEDG